MENMEAREKEQKLQEVQKKVFEGLKFFLNRETPRESLAFVIRWGNVAVYFNTRRKPRSNSLNFKLSCALCVAFTLQVFWRWGVLGQVGLHWQHIRCDGWDHNPPDCWQTKRGQAVHQQVFALGCFHFSDVSTVFLLTCVWTMASVIVSFRPSFLYETVIGQLCISGYLYCTDSSYFMPVAGTTSSPSGCTTVSMPKSCCQWRTTSSEWRCRPTSHPSWMRRRETMCPQRNWRSWLCSEERNLVQTLSLIGKPFLIHHWFSAWNAVSVTCSCRLIAPHRVAC